MPKIPLLILFKAETGTQQISMAEYRTTYTTIASDTLSNRTEKSITAAREHELKQLNLKIWNNDNIYLYTNTNLQPYVSDETRIIQYPTDSELTKIDNAQRYCTQIIDLYKTGYAFMKTFVGENQTMFIQFQKITELRRPPDSSPERPHPPPPQIPVHHTPSRIAQPLNRNELEELRRNVSRLVDYVLTTAE
jgi:hypothetical protein